MYKLLVHRQPAMNHTGKKWPDEAEEALKDWSSVMPMGRTLATLFTLHTHQDKMVLLQQQTLHYSRHKGLAEGKEEGFWVRKQG